jgi:hypothetical protein
MTSKKLKTIILAIVVLWTLAIILNNFEKRKTILGNDSFSGTITIFLVVILFIFIILLIISIFFAILMICWSFVWLALKQTKKGGKLGYEDPLNEIITVATALTIVLILLIPLWSCGIFNMGEGSTTSTGFSKIKPQLAGVTATYEGNLSAVFINGAGTQIEIGEGDIIVEEINSKKECVGQIIARPSIIARGENFEISATGCPTGARGNVYHVRITIPYTITKDGIRTKVIDTGTLRGVYE